MNQYENEIQKHENVVYEVNASEEILVFIENVATFQTRIIVHNVMYDEKHDLKDRLLTTTKDEFDSVQKKNELNSFNFEQI